MKNLTYSVTFSEGTTVPSSTAMKLTKVLAAALSVLDSEAPLLVLDTSMMFTVHFRTLPNDLRGKNG